MKCRGCGWDTTDVIAPTLLDWEPGRGWFGREDAAPGAMHWQCEVDRLRRGLDEQESIVAGFDENFEPPLVQLCEKCVSKSEIGEAIGDSGLCEYHGGEVIP